ncbi:hypothetical protein JL720_17390 [Aureococcus anophagefferens]|nr:hypothetical protein JL720_17390 [Aureococcus anophagefferens]
MTSVAARAATQDELAFLSEFLEPTTGDDSSKSDAELDCSAPAPRSPPPRGGGVAMRQVTRAELRYVLDDAAAPEPERACVSAAPRAPVDAAPRALEASTTERINLTLGAGDYVASGAAAAVDAFLAPRVDWAVGASPGARGGPLVRGCGRAQSLGGNNPWGPIVDIWARNAWAAWSRGATFVPPSLRGWYLAAPADDAFCAGAASQWACHFLPLSACDEIAESGEDDDALHPPRLQDVAPVAQRHKTASFFVDLADYAREARALAPPGQAFTLFVATDDADALRDAPRLDAEDLASSRRHPPLVEHVLERRRVPGRSEQRRAAAFLNAYLAPALRVALDAMMGPASWKGFGHYGAAYHAVGRRRSSGARRASGGREHGAAEAEAAPAAAPAAAAPRAAAATATRSRSATSRTRGGVVAVFDAGEPEALVGSPDGWLHGEDVPGKSGWVACDGGGAAISFRVECAAGDVVVGFLQSHDRRMGVASVTVAQGAAVRSFGCVLGPAAPVRLRDEGAHRPRGRRNRRVLRVLDRNQHGTARNASCPFLAAPDCATATVGFDLACT